MKIDFKNKMIKTFIITDSILLLIAFAHFIIFKKIVNIYTIGIFIFINICIYIGLHDTD